MITSDYNDIQAMYSGCTAEVHVAPVAGSESTLDIERFTYDYEFTTNDNKLGSAYPAIQDNDMLLAIANDLDPDFKNAVELTVDKEATDSLDSGVDGGGPTPSPTPTPPGPTPEFKIPNIHTDTQALYIKSLKYLEGRSVNMDYIRGLVPAAAKMRDANLYDKMTQLAKRNVEKLKSKDIAFMTEINAAVKQYKTAAASKRLGTLPKLREAPGVGLKIVKGGRAIVNGGRKINAKMHEFGVKHPKTAKAIKTGGAAGTGATLLLAGERAWTYYTKKGANGTQQVVPDSDGTIVERVLQAPGNLAKKFQQGEGHIKGEPRSNYHSNVIEKQTVTVWEFKPIYGTLAQAWGIVSNEGTAAGWFVMYPKGYPVDVKYPYINSQYVGRAKSRVNSKSIGGIKYQTLDEFYLDYDDERRRTAVGVTIPPSDTWDSGPVAVKLVYGYCVDKEQGIIVEECVDIMVSGNSTSVTYILPVRMKTRIGYRYGMVAGAIAGDFTDVDNWGFLPCNTRSPYLP